MAERAQMAEAVLAQPRASRLALPVSRLAGIVTAATVLVVLYGAVVRITGSGAGCGQHWPSCNGELAHLPQRLETWIELGHRVTSGLDFLGVLGLALVTRRSLPAGHPARIAAALAFGLIIVEVAIGARLVLLNLVGTNMSIDRAVVMPAHLVTTSLLIGSLAAATYFSSGARLAQNPSMARGQQAQLRAAFWWVVAAGVLLLVVSMTGAVTALGDTVYPVQGASSLEHLARDQADGAHFLGKLRVVHPLLALLGVAGIWIAASRARDLSGFPAISRVSGLLYLGGGLALAVGLLNVWLSAPGYMQVAHLAMACFLWLSTVVLGSMLWDAGRSPERSPTDGKNAGKR